METPTILALPPCRPRVVHWCACRVCLVVVMSLTMGTSSHFPLLPGGALERSQHAKATVSPVGGGGFRRVAPSVASVHKHPSPVREAHPEHDI